MEITIIVSDKKVNGEDLIQLLGALFPECDIRIALSNTVGVEHDLTVPHPGPPD